MSSLRATASVSICVQTVSVPSVSVQSVSIHETMLYCATYQGIMITMSYICHITTCLIAQVCDSKLLALQFVSSSKISGDNIIADRIEVT